MKTGQIPIPTTERGLELQELDNTQFGQKTKEYNTPQAQNPVSNQQLDAFAQDMNFDINSISKVGNKIFEFEGEIDNPSTIDHQAKKPKKKKKKKANWKIVTDQVLNNLDKLAKDLDTNARDPQNSIGNDSKNKMIDIQNMESRESVKKSSIESIPPEQPYNFAQDNRSNDDSASLNYSVHDLNFQSSVGKIPKVDTKFKDDLKNRLKLQIPNDDSPKSNLSKSSKHKPGTPRVIKYTDDGESQISVSNASKLGNKPTVKKPAPEEKTKPAKTLAEITMAKWAKK